MLPQHIKTLKNILSIVSKGLFVKEFQISYLKHSRKGEIQNFPMVGLPKQSLGDFASPFLTIDLEKHDSVQAYNDQS